MKILITKIITIIGKGEFNIKKFIYKIIKILNGLELEKF